MIGISGRQTKREDEITAAREDAARKVAMYYGLFAESETVQSIGSGFLDHYVDSTISLKYDQQFEKYIDTLSFDPKQNIINSDGVLFVRFTCPVPFTGTISYSSGTKPDGSPEWTSRPPVIAGNYIIGVGHSGRQLRLKDTVYKSYESAAAALAAQISTTIETKETADTGAYQNTSVIIQKSAGELNNFAVIEIWIDPDNLSVWTLAVAENRGK